MNRADLVEGHRIPLGSLEQSYTNIEDANDCQRNAAQVYDVRLHGINHHELVPVRMRTAITRNSGSDGHDTGNLADDNKRRTRDI